MDLREVDIANANRHPWEIARARCVLSLIPHGPGKAADIGAGDLYFTRILGKELGVSILAVDSNYDKCGQNDQIAMCRDIAIIPVESLDLVTLLDVLEHVEDDGGFLGRVVGCLKPGGKIIITVPAHQYLFSEHDEFLKHYRRYSRVNLLGLVAKADLRLNSVFYFFSSLYFVRLAQILLKRIGFGKAVSVGLGGWPYGDGHFITRLLTVILKFDFYVCRQLNRIGINLTGLSLCVVCEKHA